MIGWNFSYSVNTCTYVCTREQSICWTTYLANQACPHASTYNVQVYTYVRQSKHIRTYVCTDAKQVYLNGLRPTYVGEHG